MKRRRASATKSQELPVETTRQKIGHSRDTVLSGSALPAIERDAVGQLTASSLQCEDNAAPFVRAAVLTL